jgi:hypothetical protein
VARHPAAWLSLRLNGQAPRLRTGSLSAPEVLPPHNLQVLVADGFLAHMTTDGRRLTEFCRAHAGDEVGRVPDPSDVRAALIRASPAADRGFRLARARIAEVEREWRLLLGEPAVTEFATMLARLETWAEGASR